ncbi:MAG: DNA polymerase/3'-5' exonuclease PolX [Candidatus Binatia bacterium]
MQDRFYIAAALREIGRLLELKGENLFKARAYERAARSLEEIQGDPDALVRKRRLTEIPGIGSALAAVIEEIYRTGQSRMLEKLRQELPPGAIELNAVPGLSLKKIIALHDALKVATVADVKAACEQGLVGKVKGFGQKTETKLLAAIARLQKREQRMLLDRALEEAERLLQHVRAAAEVAAADIAGSVRRRKESAGRFKIVAASKHPKAVIDHFLRFPAFAQCVGKTGQQCIAQFAEGTRAELNVVSPSDYVAALHFLTGSKKHCARLEGFARAQGISFGSHVAVQNTRKFKHEAEIYQRLGMQYIPPELREDKGEIEAAAAGTLPVPITLEDIQGITHCHTTYSDGQNSVEEMALAAEAMGMKYLTITDHSPSAFYARGVKIDRLMTQWEEIDRVQGMVRITLLRGTESDIRENGSLDYPDRILEQFDIIIASIHARAKMDRDQMTRRIVQAIQSPFFKVWGHPLGRLIQSRPPLECRMEEVLDAVAESRAAIEVNGDPRRLDLEPRWIRAARERGIKFIVSTDAHSVRNLRNLQHGVSMARRGWLTRDEVLNTMNTEAFRKAVHP